MTQGDRVMPPPEAFNDDGFIIVDHRKPNKVMPTAVLKHVLEELSPDDYRTEMEEAENIFRVNIDEELAQLLSREEAEVLRRVLSYRALKWKLAWRLQRVLFH